MCVIGESRGVGPFHPETCPIEHLGVAWVQAGWGAASPEITAAIRGQNFEGLPRPLSPQLYGMFGPQMVNSVLCFFSGFLLNLNVITLIYPHLGYGIRLWGSCAQHKLERVFRLQKKAVRVILNLKTRESCRKRVTIPSWCQIDQ
ncbi:hypothetical protein J6590_074761 [Homalodisca vitripennis]|nr:hypothetical protein J6590_074761 [Homalodisca vitripennis]